MKIFKSKNRYKKRINIIIISLLFMLFLIPTQASYGQFGYVGAGIDYSCTIFENSYLNNSPTISNVFALNIGGLYRPLKWIGIGCSFSKPIIQSNKFSFQSSSSPSLFYDFDPEYIEDERYLPEIYDYKIRFGNSATIFGRLYYTENLYAECSISTLTINEHFQFKRDGFPALYETDPTEYNYGDLITGSIEMVDIDINKDHKVLIPGFALGATNNLNKHLYYDLWGGLKFIKFGSPSFTEMIGSRWDDIDDDTELVEITSKLSGTKISINLGIRIGYRF